MIKKHIEIVSSTQTELSSMSQESRDAIFSVLSKRYADVRITIVNNTSDLEALVGRNPDLVFLGMKFIPKNPRLGRDDPDKIWLAEYLDNCGIAYTGSSHMAHELELDKSLAKQRVLDAGLSTSPFHLVPRDNVQKADELDFSYPSFIKPANRGGGMGVDSKSVAHNLDQLQSKVRALATDLGADSLIEKYLPGREFSVAILRDEQSQDFMVMPIELITKPDEHGICVLSEYVKSSNSEQAVEVTDRVLAAKVSDLALNVFYALGARDYGRIDIRLDADGTPHFLEANLLPSLISGYGSFPKACSINVNLDYEPMIMSIVSLAFARNLEIIEDEEIQISPTVDTALAF